MTTTRQGPPPDGAAESDSPIPNTARAREAAAAQAAGTAGAETRGERVRRIAYSARLHGHAIGVVAVGAILIALAASNTARVRISWIFGESRVSLVWLVLVAAVIGWALGLLTGSRLQRLARRRRRGESR